MCKALLIIIFLLTLSGFISYTGFFFLVLEYFHLYDSSLVNPAHLGTEFWNREDEASISGEDISDSDGRSVNALFSVHFTFRRYLLLLLA